jgi:glycosyltransferase involved in cell wall biosynthesis
VKHRILHIAAGLRAGGTATELANVAGGLPAADFESQVVLLQPAQHAVEMLRGRGVEPTVRAWRGALDVIAFWRLVRQVRRAQPAVVHVWLPNYCASHAWGAAVVASTGKIVVTVRRSGAHEAGGLPFARRWCASRTNRFVVNSAAGRAGLLAGEISENKILFIPNAAPPSDTQLTADAANSRHELVAELSLPLQAKLIAYVGSLTVEKRLRELIWATDQLKAVGVEAHLLVIGEGPLRVALERYARLNHIAERVHFLGFRDDARQIVSQCDVLWQAGAREGQSSAVLGAMAAGIPVVAAAAGGNPELVVNGQSGYLVPLRERAGFARWTLPLLEDAALAKRFGAAGRERAQKLHRWEDYIARYAKVYRELIDS